MNFQKTTRLVLVVVLCCFYFAGFTPAQDEKEDVVSFAAIGDSGCGCSAQKAIADQMMKWHNIRPFDLVFMLGDNIYGEDIFGGIWTYGKKGGHPALFPSRFDRYYEQLQNRGVRFHAALGNHDLEADGGKSMIDDTDRFGIEDEKGYYDVSPEEHKDLVEFFVINSNTLVSGSPDQEQLDWLKEELSDSDARWKVVISHHPVYSPPGSHGADLALRKNLEDILINGGVQLFLAGHNHYYARMFPQNKIHYFVSGGGGRDLKTPRKTEDTVRIARTYHFLYFEARPDKMQFWAISHAGTLLDYGTF